MCIYMYMYIYTCSYLRFTNGEIVYITCQNYWVKVKTNPFEYWIVCYTFFVMWKIKSRSKQTGV